MRKGKAKREMTDINSVVREAVKMMQFELRRMELQPQLVLSDGIPGVLADAVQLEQVLVNLLQNAMEAMHDTPSWERQLILKTGLGDDETVRVSVSDAGCGVSPELRGVLFDSFVTTKPNGLGLGLAISRSIIGSHGGRLQAIDNQDRGMTFEFALPAALRGAPHEAGGYQGFRGG